MKCGCNGAKKSPATGGSTFLGPLEFKDCGCGCNGRVAYDKFMISLLSAVLFYIFAHPVTFKFIRGVLGEWVSSTGGCPSGLGLILHAFIYMLVVWGIMNIKNIRSK